MADYLIKNGFFFFFFTPLALGLYGVCMARFWFRSSYRGDFCEKLLKTSPMSNWLQDGPDTGQG